MSDRIKNLETFLDREEARCQKVIDDLKTELNNEETNVLWALRRPERIIEAAVALRRYGVIRQQLESFKTALSGEDADFTKKVSENLGGLTEDAFLAHIDDSFQKDLINRATRGGSGMLGESDIQAKLELEFVANWLDNRMFRRF